MVAKIVKIVLKVTWSDSSWRFACGDVFAFFQESLRFRLISAELFPLTTLVLCDGMEIQYKVDHCYCRLLPLFAESHVLYFDISIIDLFWVRKKSSCKGKTKKYSPYLSGVWSPQWSVVVMVGGGWGQSKYFFTMFNLLPYSTFITPSLLIQPFIKLFTMFSFFIIFASIFMLYLVSWINNILL